MTDDIVARLRIATRPDVQCVKREAADEIERLRKEAFALAAWSCREIDRITAERDEARRAYCEEAFAHRFNERGGIGPITDPKQIAQGMQWDCFKENIDD